MPKSLQARLRAERERQNLSQADLAAAVGASDSAIGDWERGRTEPSASHIAALARRLHVTGDYLLGLSDTATSLPLNHWLIDMGVIERLRNSERVSDPAWACPIPERHAIVSAAEFDSLRREVERLVAHPPRKKRR